MHIPKLRFQEFTDEWQKVLLENRICFFNGKGHETIIDPNGKYILINSKFISTNGKIKKRCSKQLFPLYKNDIVMVMSDLPNGRALAKCFYIDEDYKYTLNQRICCLKAKFDDPKFLYYRINRNRHFLKFDDGVNQTNLRKNDVLSTSLFIPTYEEQKKLAKFLTILDQKIDLQSQKIDNLKLYKKWITEKIFSNITGNDTPLYFILKERKEYERKGSIYPHVTLSKEGIYDKGERYNRDFLVKDQNKNYKITKRNDLCYNPANLKFGVICINQYGSAIFSPIYVTFEIDQKYNPKFIGYYVTRNNFINAVRKYEQGTVYERMAVSPDDFIKFHITIPSRKKQDKIALILDAIEKKIQCNIQNLNTLENLKKGLIQDMFV